MAGGENLAFITDPLRYLQTKTVLCYTATGAKAQKDDLDRIKGNDLGLRQEFPPDIEFDLVRNKGGWVDLKMLGVVGSYGKTGRHGRPILGNYIPYLGQKDKKPDSKEFGRINLSRVKTDYVFTFTLSGCNFVVTREDGDVYVYHEPTSASWARGPDYHGATILNARIGPAYDDFHISDYGCLVRDKMTRRRWHAYCQSPNGLTMAKDRLTTATIDV